MTVMQRQEYEESSSGINSARQMTSTYREMFLTFGLFLIAFRFQLPSLLFLIIVISFNIKSFQQRRAGWFWLLFISLFFAIYLLFGMNHYERGADKFIPRILVIYMYFLFFYSLGSGDESINKKRLSKFSLFSVIYVYLVCVYSQINGYPGYNGIYDVFNGNEENSPLYALQLIIFTITYIHLNKNKVSRFFLLFLVAVSVYFSVVFLGSRASFILLVFYFLLNIIKHKKMMLFILLISIPVVIISIGFLQHFNIFNYLDFGGFKSRGLDSPRFSMLEYGISNFLKYPLGGLQAHGIGYEGIWFHNMLLDIVRVAGYYAMFLWVLILFIAVVNMYFMHKEYMCLFLILNIALMQDLAFDGFFNIMALEFFLLGVIVSKRKMHTQKLVCGK
ncbi:hypothetical protein AXA59_19020 [Enterobacter hormaechei]|uniref:hypothetical protein n=1 Tax=Enterobacter hormaechei TaxID=158836 RepID=UPI000D7E9590|nr:hypothetical protein [Enterobacter hormaechei]AWS77501.1 hypothetical protein AM401_03105 [Enterobacter cloacae complex sp.]HCJ7642248.1 hypothetical protein [Enterobacter hormaechei subsp. xiangfangensis]AXO46670.1 hypothetical protein AXA59_19020 [Enterobacter hormaechei]EKG3234999.1 hypothetical protein [Enterobacter hormaechei]MCM7544713.1 hypothetical protein [Enterobacter hormaechei]